MVYRAREKATNQIVALKRLKMEKEKEGFPITSLREVNTLLKVSVSLEYGTWKWKWKVLVNDLVLFLVLHLHPLPHFLLLYFFLYFLCLKICSLYF